MYVYMYMDIYVHTYLGVAAYVCTYVGVLTTPGHSQESKRICVGFCCNVASATALSCESVLNSL